MTLEELEAKVAELTELTKAQDETNKGLKADLTKAKAELRKGQEIDPNEYNALQTENESLKGKVSALDKEFKKATGERDILAKTLETESKITIEMQRDADLTNALASINVTNQYNLKAAKAILAAQVQVVTEGDKRLSKVGQIALSDYLKEWATTDEGKHYIAAPNNSGGGSGGGNNNLNNTAKQIPRSQFDAMSVSDRKAFSVDGGKIVD